MAEVNLVGWWHPPLGACFFTMKEIIDRIKAKKPLNRLDDEFVSGFLNDFFKRDAKSRKKFINNELKKRDIELIVKSVRNELNIIYGQFWLSDKLELEAHKSTKERIEFYDRIYKKIFSITGKPKTIFDLACGLNPLTYNLIGKDVYFYVTELTEYDCDQLREYFKKNNIKSEVIKVDLRTYNNFPKVDVAFLFKVLDSIESNGHLLAEHLIKSINAKYIIVSFSTKTTKGKKMNYPQRGWFERMLNRLNLKYEIHYEPNEVFYLVKK